MLYTKNVIDETDFAQIKYLCHPIISYAHRHYQVCFCKYNHGSFSQERIPPQVLSHVIRFTQYRYLYFFYASNCFKIIFSNISLEYENK